MASVSLFNPIPRALAHYEHETRDTLTRIGQKAVVRESVSIEGAEGVAALRTAIRHLTLPRRVKQDLGETLVLWPALGLLEPRLWSRSSARIRVIFHDPEPLRSQVGFGPLARVVGRRTRPPVRLLSHSAEATAVLRRRFPGLWVDEVRHPVLSERRHHATVPGRVLVAGQFKPVRDLELLAELGPMLRARGYDTRIVGSGWPDIDGWSVDSRFLSEGELDDELGAAAVIVLPYRRYFQSGIALRALENGTSTVGTRTGFLEQVNGTDSPWLLEPESPAGAWVDAIVNGGPHRDSFADYQKECDMQWTSLLDDKSGPRGGAR